MRVQPPLVLDLHYTCFSRECLADQMTRGNTSHDSIPECQFFCNLNIYNFFSTIMVMMLNRTKTRVLLMSHAQIDDHFIMHNSF